MKDNKGHGSSKRGMAKVSHSGPIGYKIADIGPGGKEHNVKTNAAWDAHHKAHAPKSSQGSYANGTKFHGK